MNQNTVVKTKRMGAISRKSVSINTILVDLYARTLGHILINTGLIMYDGGQKAKFVFLTGTTKFIAKHS